MPSSQPSTVPSFPSCSFAPFLSPETYLPAAVWMEEGKLNDWAQRKFPMKDRCLARASGSLQRGLCHGNALFIRLWASLRPKIIIPTPIHFGERGGTEVAWNAASISAHLAKIQRDSEFKTMKHLLRFFPPTHLWSLPTSLARGHQWLDVSMLYLVILLGFCPTQGCWEWGRDLTHAHTN